MQRRSHPYTHTFASLRIPIRVIVVLMLFTVHVRAVDGTSPTTEAPDPSIGGGDVDARSIDDAALGQAGETNATPDPDWSEEQLKLRSRLRECLAKHYTQSIDVSRHSPWSIMHNAIGYGVDGEVVVRGSRVNAIAWLCSNNPSHGQRLLSMTDDVLQVHEGPGLQGHPGQFLAVLAQARVRRTYGIKVNGHDLTVADLIETEQRTCDSQQELTFKLLALSYYLDTETTWENQLGETWSLSRMIREELRKPVVQEAPCGGTHRLMGLSYAVRKREKEKGTFDGQWKRAQQYVVDFHDYAFQVQNPDGSFSTEWFRARGASEDLDRRLQTTGHILEWLVYSLPKDDLTQPRVTKSVAYLMDLMLERSSNAWPIGPQGHAIHALALYDERVFGGKPGQRSETLANRQSSRRDVR